MVHQGGQLLKSVVYPVNTRSVVSGYHACALGSRVERAKHVFSSPKVSSQTEGEAQEKSRGQIAANLLLAGCYFIAAIRKAVK
jgi:hypothetical protein